MITIAARRSLAVGVVLVAACAWLILHRAADAAWTADQPERAAQFGPHSGTLMAGIALRRVIAAGGVVDDESRGLAAEALRRSPASSLPLVLGGFDAATKGDLMRATALMEAARTRDPRAALARTWLLNEYVRTGRYAEALNEAGPVMRFDDGTRPQIYALIVQMTALPGGAAAVRVALSRNPDWRAPFIQALPGMRPSSSAIAAIREGLSPPGDPGAAAAEERAFKVAESG